MSMPAGLPPPRPDQRYAPSGAPMAPGSPNVVRARQVIVSGPTGAVVGVFVYAAGATPGAGTGPIASMTNQVDDPFGNPTEAGVAAYVPIAGTTFAVQLGAGNFAGTTVPALFIHDMSNPAFSDPSFGGNGEPTGSVATVFSGQAGAGSTGSGLQATDSTGSGVAGGEVDIIAGLTTVSNNLTVEGVNLNLGNGGNALINLNPQMASPPNWPTAGKTLAATQTCLDAIIQSLKNRGMVVP
jgi:hypothetical protein